MSTTTRSSNRRLMIPAFAVITLSLFVHACGGGGGSSSGGGGSPAPSPGPGPTGFVSTAQVPADSATDVALLPVILIAFNDTVNPATLIGNVTLTQGAAPIPSTLTYLACNNRVQLIPNQPLNPATPYGVNLLAGLQDDDGTAITPISRTFTTSPVNDTLRPTASMVAIDINPGDANDPMAAANQTTMMYLDWDDASDLPNLPATLSYRVYATTTGCFDFGAPVAIAGPGITEVAVPGLSPRTEYTFTVRAVDGAGNESLNTDTVTATTFTSFLQNVYPIVATSCTSCHNPGGQATMPPTSPIITMDYSSPLSVYTSWLGSAVPPTGAATSWTPPGFTVRVDPGDPAASWLYEKISSATPAGGGFGTQMPYPGTVPLSAANQDVFFDWIFEGALNN